MKKSLFEALQTTTWGNIEPSYVAVESFNEVSKEISKMCMPVGGILKIEFDVCSIKYILEKNEDNVDITISTDVNTPKEGFLKPLTEEKSVKEFLGGDISGCKFRLNNDDVLMLEQYKETINLDYLGLLFEKLDILSRYNYQTSLIGTAVVSKTIDLMNFMSELHNIIGDEDFKLFVEIVIDHLENSVNDDGFMNSVGSLNCRARQGMTIQLKISGAESNNCVRMVITAEITERRTMEYKDSYNKSEVNAIIGVLERRINNESK